MRNVKFQKASAGAAAYVCPSFIYVSRCSYAKLVFFFTKIVHTLVGHRHTTYSYQCLSKASQSRISNITGSANDRTNWRSLIYIKHLQMGWMRGSTREQNVRNIQKWTECWVAVATSYKQSAFETCHANHRASSWCSRFRMRGQAVVAYINNINHNVWFRQQIFTHFSSLNFLKVTTALEWNEKKLNKILRFTVELMRAFGAS